MTTTINADNGVVSGSAGLKYSSDSSGVLELQTSGTAAVTISAAQVVTFANPPIGVFPSGTALLFQQTTAPTGWTKSTTHDNKALRVVSGSVTTGGSVAFTTAFASQAVAGSVGTSGATTLSTAQIPSHSHTAPAVVLWGAAVTGTPNLFCGTTTLANSGTPTSTYYGPNTGAAGGGGSHDHSGGTFTGTAINLAVQYVDVIIATKN